jgi:glycerol-3-phosphate dehydrogenase
MAAVEAQFPSLDLTLNDVISTFSGVRPVIGTGKMDPSRESRDHVVWEENGLLTVTGGKLTTFRLIALDTLKAVRHRLSDLPSLDNSMAVLNPVNVDLPGTKDLSESIRRRLLGRYGACAPGLAAAAKPGELKMIPGTQILWAELRWAARAEGVVHLEDLLLRRVRLGLFLPQGGRALLPNIRAMCQPELDWDDTRWEKEEAAYLALWQRCYSLPEPGSIPGWKAMLAEAKSRRQAQKKRSRRKLITRFAAGLLASFSLTLYYLWRRRSQPGEEE